ncbi:MAG: protoheme IX farnesyltransferase [Rhodospirillaceae bacterium]|nr:protoheme IX farnesyltransferase [Rhodospirillaceae bacterium]
MTDNSITHQTTGQNANPTAQEDGPEPINQNQFVDYALLLKPRVMSLVLFTGVAGMLLAPGKIDLLTAFIAVVCIAVGAGASGAINMWYDRDIDSVMERTMNRPLPAGRLKPPVALWLGTTLSLVSVGVMGVWVNLMSAGLLAVTIAFYVFVYTIWLKRRTPQNIVIGGASGALPPMIGWAAVTNDISIGSLTLFAIIFMWTPPHFWALSLYRSGDYEKAGVPMMPVVSGIEKTKRQILIYTLFLFPFTLVPAFVGMISLTGGLTIGGLGIWFIRHALLVLKSERSEEPRAMFRYSILYLFLIFVVLLADHALLTTGA